jgi:hypothetical protein
VRRAHSSDAFICEYASGYHLYASFTPEDHGCAVTIENYKKCARDVHEWTLSTASVEEIERGTAQKALPSPCVDAGATPELNLRGCGTLRLAVCRLARGKVNYLCLHMSHMSIPTNWAEYHKISIVFYRNIFSRIKWYWNLHSEDYLYSTEYSIP